MSTPDFVAVADAIVETLSAGTFAGADIVALRQSGTGEIRPPATAVVTSPALTYEPYGEGFRVTASDWPISLYTTKGHGEPDLELDMQFLAAVTDALAADPTLGGFLEFGLIAYPTSSPRPEQVPISGTARGKGRTMLRRELGIHIDH